ncbi:MAG: hypothetical protein Q9219_001921 [cf. Caloplaca sp. 3 TL-2023]
MLSFKLLLAAVMAGFVAAQNTTSSSGSGSSSSDNTIFDENSVDRTTRTQWCADQTTNCPKLCGGPKFFKENRCVAMESSTTFSCLCSNGTSPDLEAYANTFPSDSCQARFAACRQQNPGSQSCIQCGTLKADDVPASTSSAAAASTAAATSSASGTEPSATAATTGAPSSGGNILVGAEMGVKGAVGLLAAMGLML